MDAKVGSLMSMLKPKQDAKTAAAPKPEGASSAADDAARAFVASPSAATFRDLMDLCRDYEGGGEDEA